MARGGILAGALCVLGCAQKAPEPPRVPDHAQLEAGPQPPARAPTADVSLGLVTADQYLAEVSKDEVAAVAKYRDKVLEVSGYYQDQLAGEGGGHIFLTAAPAARDSDRPVIDGEFGPVEGRVDPRFRSLSPGQAVTIRGKVWWANARALVSIELVSLGQSTAVPTTLAEIEAALDPKSDAEMHAGKDLFLRITISNPESSSAVVPPPGSRRRYRLDTPLGNSTAVAALARARATPGREIMVLARARTFGEEAIMLEVRPIDTPPQGLTLPKEK